MKKINKIFKKFDIIHFHTFSLIHFLALKKIKCIYTIHGLSKGVRQENLIKYYIRENLKKYFLNRVSFFIANSKFTLKLSKEHYGLKNISKRVVLNGSKTNITISNIKNDYNNEFTIGVVTRFTKRKRIDRLINAFYMFIQKGGNGKLVIVGNGQTFEEIEDLIKDKSLSSYVILKGYDIEVGKYYSTFDITVFPSESEPFGLVALEAYCFGLPVLAFHDSGGLKEIIEPLDPQNIVDDEESLSLRMLFYYKNKDLISTKSNERKMYVLNNFSIDRMESEYNNIYRSLLNL
jgi:glycosyltransferase involved in cell wall biosynthesis